MSPKARKVSILHDQAPIGMKYRYIYLRTRQISKQRVSSDGSRTTQQLCCLAC
ncbi:hypothetical protein K523DRAFT_103359 [Schizophyllum commune Tattone D]|nr:hypothetical protein K523DRAFT_103359 [Schizophyllum commune Tattone D]